MEALESAVGYSVPAAAPWPDGGFGDLVQDLIKQKHGKQEELKGISPRAQSKARRAWRGPTTRDGGPDGSCTFGEAYEHPREEEYGRGRCRNIRNFE